MIAARAFARAEKYNAEGWPRNRFAGLSHGGSGSAGIDRSAFTFGLAIRATLACRDGRGRARAVPLPWHPWLFHYGRTWRVSRGGDDYVLHVTAAPPEWRRYGRTTGRRFADPVDVTFSNVRVHR